MVGASQPRIAVSNVTITSNTTDPVSGSAHTLNTTGDIERFTTLGGTVDIGDWITPKGANRRPTPCEPPSRPGRCPLARPAAISR